MVLLQYTFVLSYFRELVVAAAGLLFMPWVALRTLSGRVLEIGERFFACLSHYSHDR